MRAFFNLFCFKLSPIHREDLKVELHKFNASIHGNVKLGNLEVWKLLLKK